MKYLLIIVVVIASLVIIGILILKYKLDHAPDRHNLEQNIDKEVGKLLAPGTGMVVGVYKNGKTYIKGYGTISKASTTSPSGTTLFQIGSITKVFTAATLMRLVDSGQFSFDDTLEEIMGDTVVLDPRVKDVTLEQLVTHTSGFPKLPKLIIEKITEAHGGNEKEALKNPYQSLSWNDITKYLANAEDKGKPGRFKYSNLGMGLVGHSIETKIGLMYEAVVKQEILDPLGMGDTNIVVPKEKEERFAQGYTGEGEPNELWTFGALASAGALNSTVSDMMLFVRANLEDTSPISSSLQKMHIPRSGGKTGIGWMQATLLDRFVGNDTVVTHGGNVGGYSSYVAVDPKHDVGVVILYNELASLNMLGTMMTRAVRTQSWKEK